MDSPTEFVHVWTWLPGATSPTPAGGLRWNANLVPEFAYRDAYLDRADRFPLAPEAPTRHGWFQPEEGLSLHGFLADGLPDSWGQQVLRTGRPQAFEDDANEQRVLMLNSGTDRFGALDFQRSGTIYEPRASLATLDELHRAAEMIEAGERLSPELDAALLHGTSIGGARPKALLTDPATRRSFIAKFASTSDRGLPVVNAEAACLDLARRVGITAAKAEVAHSLGKDVLLVERFDRDRYGHRFHTVSALTISKLDASIGRYATYPDIYDALMSAGAAPESGAELFDRIVFNVAVSNSDDHARNHAAFWDGANLNLTPAYDITPGHRSGETAQQALAIGRRGERDSTFETCIEASAIYGLSPAEARESVDRIATTIREHWTEVSEEARLTDAQASRLLGRQILNPYTSYGYEPRVFAAPESGWTARLLVTTGGRRATQWPVPGHCNALTGGNRYCANFAGCKVSGHAQ
jgi:serine/threonine-protein kinase HipA